MPVPDYSDPTPARRQIADDLRAQIRSGRYSPGDRLPSNIALSEAYGVATETIRAALDELRAERTVETRSTRGTYVTSVPPADPRPDAGAVADLRARVEQLEARLGRVERDLRSAHGGPDDHAGGGSRQP